MRATAALCGRESEAMPVSYTHLDVYKRQAQKNPKEMKKMMKKAGASAERAMETIDRVLNSH